ncbi:MAG: hypothetical protein M1829_006377 [Trizodia sp. TS-e1964]|nr:MAG: hypothetical protein M1829_006377 [Trizodia sp. TS-e1964]
MSPIDVVPSTAKSGSKIVKLKVPSKFLAPYGPPRSLPLPPSGKGGKPKSKLSQSSTPGSADDEPATTPCATDNISEPSSASANDAPVPTALPPAADEPKKKTAPAAKAGTKRGIAAVDGQAKPRGKPGPKKKPRLGDGKIDYGNTGPPAKASNSHHNGHKLGPKANQGAINAGLRALDRSGTPCRKWTRGRKVITTFTGISWSVPSWGAPKIQKVEIPATSPGPQIVVSTDSKENKGESSVVTEKSRNSEKSNSGGDAVTVEASSPPTPATITA